MQTSTFVVAVLGVVLSTASLSWQAATFILTGGRVKLALQTGAVHNSGSGMIVSQVTGAWSMSAERLALQGYTRPVVAVQVRNVGRLPVTVTKWSIFESAKGTAFLPLADSIGPSLPYRLDAGVEETWALDAMAAQKLVQTTADVFQVPQYL
ncbi:MAG: hypothetical protein ACRDTG_08615 [Pseudonocardiaceae bacterium]